MHLKVIRSELMWYIKHALQSLECSDVVIRVQQKQRLYWTFVYICLSVYRDTYTFICIYIYILYICTYIYIYAFLNLDCGEAVQFMSRISPSETQKYYINSGQH